MFPSTETERIVISATSITFSSPSLAAPIVQVSQRPPSSASRTPTFYN